MVMDVCRALWYMVQLERPINEFDIVPELMSKLRQRVDLSPDGKLLIVCSLLWEPQRLRDSKYFKDRQPWGFQGEGQVPDDLDADMPPLLAQESEKLEAILNHPLVQNNLKWRGWHDGHHVQ